MTTRDPSSAQPEPEAGRSWGAWFAMAWTCWWAGWTVLCLLVAVAQWTGLDPAHDVDAAMGLAITSVLTGALTASGVVMYRNRRRLPLAQPPVLSYLEPTLSSIPPPQVRVEKRYRLPAPKSAAREPMRRLGEAEAALAELLRQLSEPADVVEQAWRTACDTAARLRALGARLEAVELAARHAPEQDRPALMAGAGSLLTHLDEGVDGYRALIAAAGHVLIASTPVPAADELVEATEKLASFAAALQEIPDYRS